VKRLATICTIVLLAATASNAQNIARRQTVSAPGRYQVQNLTGQFIFAHNLSWTVTGSVTSCTIRMNQSLLNPQIWNDLGPTMDCTAAGLTPIVSVSRPSVYVAVQVVSFSGSGSVSFVYQGWMVSPAVVSAGSRTQLGSVAFGSLGTVVPGQTFYCPDCDPVSVSGVANECTSAGAQTGAVATGTFTKWACMSVN